MSGVPVDAPPDRRAFRLLETPLLLVGVLLLSVALAAVPGAVADVLGREELRNHLLAGVPGVLFVVGWWLAHAEGVDEPAWSPYRSSLLTCGVVLPALGVVALVLGAGPGLPGTGAGDLVVTGATLVLVGAVGRLLSTVSQRP